MSTRSKITSQTRFRSGYLLLAVICCVGCSHPDQDLQRIEFGSDGLFQQLEPLGRAIANSRIVLLGENGHGVGDFSRVKAELVAWLHEKHGFDVVAFESGYFECGNVWNRIDSLSTREAFNQCLRYAFQHAEILPLFEYIRQERDTDTPLILAGMDLQAQGFDSELRPETVREFLFDDDPALASEIARIDSMLFLPAASGGLGDSLFVWAAANADYAKSLYARAEALSDGWERWVYRLASGWVDRLAIRGRGATEAAEEGAAENTAERAREGAAENTAEHTPEGAASNPGRFIEIRDEWMARTIAALADSIDGSRKVVVWLHNDHARYGMFESGGNPIHSVGGYLRERYGPDVFSVGLFMGSGSVVDNGRIAHAVEPLPVDGIESYLGSTGDAATYLILRGNTNTAARRWAEATRPYLRMGFDLREMVPADEFDAVLYLKHVEPPDFDVR